MDLTHETYVDEGSIGQAERMEAPIETLQDGTPETETTTHYFWGTARDFDIQDAGFTRRFQNQQGHLFAEDVEVLEAQQRSIEANPDMKLRGINIDQGGVKARLVIQRLIKAQQLEREEGAQ